VRGTLEPGRSARACDVGHRVLELRCKLYVFFSCSSTPEKQLVGWWPNGFSLSPLVDDHLCMHHSVCLAARFYSGGTMAWMGWPAFARTRRILLEPDLRRDSIRGLGSGPRGFLGCYGNSMLFVAGCLISRLSSGTSTVCPHRRRCIASQEHHGSGPCSP
jgi:hypothetical protein